MFKLAIDAGHGLYTAGKRCDKKLDPSETREWVLNSRIAEKEEAILKQYEGIEIIRVDDRSGKTDVSLADRYKKANEWGADLYLSHHHNAGAKLTNAGGTVVYVRKNPLAKSVEWQKELYDEIIKETGLKGNRSTPISRSNFTVIYRTKMPAVLIEFGFMDSKIDTPVILTEEFADQCARACANVIIRRAGLNPKGTDIESPAAPPEPVKPAETPKAEHAQSKDESLRGKYVVDSYDGVLSLRTGASVDKQLIEEMKNGQTVRCYGWHTGSWLYVVAESGNVGFCHKNYLKRV